MEIKRNNKMQPTKKESFLRNHADTLTIIGVNLAIAGMLVSMWVSHASRIDATNARIDATYNMIYAIINQGKK